MHILNWSLPISLLILNMKVNNLTMLYSIQTPLHAIARNNSKYVINGVGVVLSPW